MVDDSQPFQYGPALERIIYMLGLDKDQGLVTKEYAARFLAVSVRTIERLITEGELRAVKVMRSTRIPAVALQDYINRHTLKTAEWSP